jgi:hypothetical protein
LILSRIFASPSTSIEQVGAYSRIAEAGSNILTDEKVSRVMVLLTNSPLGFRQNIPLPPSLWQDRKSIKARKNKVSVTNLFMPVNFCAISTVKIYFSLGVQTV